MRVKAPKRISLYLRQVGAVAQRAAAAGYLLAVGSGPLAVALTLSHHLGRATAWHATFCVNSVCHGHHDKADVTCHARDVPWLGLLTCGEASGHVVHHQRPRSARQAPPGSTDIGFIAIYCAAQLGLIRMIAGQGAKGL